MSNKRYLLTNCIMKYLVIVIILHIYLLHVHLKLYSNCGYIIIIYYNILSITQLQTAIKTGEYISNISEVITSLVKVNVYIFIV